MEKKPRIKKVIIFDDDDDILFICSYLLDEQGWEVHTFTDTNDVIKRVEAIQPDLILMDNWIPENGGIAATQQLKQHEVLKAIPVIYFSANLEIASLAAHAGANTYLPKPFDVDRLNEIMSTLISA
jgi:CheY-like chemotaxis protein